MDDATLMRRAVTLALRGPVATPNPRVGCIIARDGEVIAEGWHQGAGTAHAEAAALAWARAHNIDVRGATAYATLEPCTHTGRTGPCAQALIDAGISRVVIGSPDPNPVASGGAWVLRQVGVEVVEGVEREACDDVNRVWLASIRLGRPFVTWKFAATLDGRSAADDGSSRWITSPDARALVHRLRAECDAILVGTGTAVADDPWLTVRHDGVLAERQPLRVVMGTRPLPTTSRVLDDAAETLILPTHDPSDALAQLWQREIRHVWLEGGPTVAAAFLAADLVDEVHAFVAPALLGSGRAALADLGITSMADIRRLRLTSLAQVGDDAHLVCTRKEN